MQTSQWPGWPSPEPLRVAHHRVSVPPPSIPGEVSALAHPPLSVFNTAVCLTPCKGRDSPPASLKHPSADLDSLQVAGW